MPELLNVYLAKRNCEDCGHDIRECYEVRFDNGAVKTVGSTCIVSVMGVVPERKALLERRMKAARRQWKRCDPAPREGEDQTAYVNRRLREMEGARAAWETSQKYNVRRILNMAEQALYEKHGWLRSRTDCPPHISFEYGHTSDLSTCPVCAQRHKEAQEYYQALAEEEARLKRELLEEPFGANLFDFWYKPAYKLP